MEAEAGGLVVQPRRLRALVAVGGLVLCVLTAVLVADWSTSRSPWLDGLARALIVGAPIAVGLYAHGRPPFSRFGTLLIGVGVVWFLATLSSSPDSVLYSVGRVAAWPAELVIVYVILAFPTGRLTDRADRLLVRVMALDVLVLYLPTALLVDQFPVPTVYTSCTEGCPANAFDVVGQQPAFVENVVYPLREIVAIAVFLGVTVRLAARLRAATPVMRRTIEPVLAVAIFRVAALGLTIFARRVAPDSEQLLDIGVWLIALALPAMALAFLIGLVRWRLFVAGAMQKLATRLPGHAQPEQLQTALADAFDDPSIEIVYWLDGTDQHWVDALGRRFEPPLKASGRWLSEVRDDGTPVAAIVHDAGLRNDDAFLATATSYALMTLDNQRLSAQARALLREVSDSRARIQATADDERRRIERDLHDGAQQRLVALRIKLELVAEETSDAERAARLRRLGIGGRGGDRRGALAGARDLSGGARRPRPRGGAALGGAAVAAADHGAGRRGRPLLARDRDDRLLLLPGGAPERRQARSRRERGGDRPLRHGDAAARGARRRRRLRPARRPRRGPGFVNMRDRLAAVAGELATVSSPGKGARIVVTIPLSP